MKSSRVMRVFENYVKKYDMNNANIKAKYFHSLKVMELSKTIAMATGKFSDDEIVVCELIGLFHEIASFDKVNDFHLKDDNDDETMKTLNILFDNNLIKELTSDMQYNEIIKMAIYSYNKGELPSDLAEGVRKFCLVIRDAHSLDMFRVALNYPYFDMHIEVFPNEMVYDTFKKCRPISKKIADNNSDEVLVILSSVFSINYGCSYALLKENRYLNKLIDGLYFSDKKVEDFFKQLLLVLNNYVDKQIIGR